MNDTSKLTTFQAILFVLIVMVNKIILNFPKKVILQTESGSIINLVYIGVLLIFSTLLICKLLSKFPGNDIIDVSNYVGGKPLKIAMGAIFIFFFFIAILLINTNFSLMLKTIYFKTSPIIFIYAFFTIGIIIANKLGFRAIAKTNTIIIPFTVISILFIFFGTIQEFKTEQLFPIFGNNFAETFLYGTTNIFAFSGLAYLYLIPPLLKDFNSYKKVSFISIAISWIFLFLSVLCLLMILPYSAYSHELNSLYIITRLVKFGEFLKRTDALFILLWVLSTLSYLSIELFFTVYLTKKLVTIENEKMLIYSYASITVALCLIPSNEAIIYFIEDYIFKYGSLIVIFGICIAILLIANIKKKIEENNS